jgi:hypothetical protein
MAKQTQRQTVLKFINNSRQHDIVVLIEKLLGTISSIANKQDVVIDLTSLLDSPTRADPFYIDTAVQALCELDLGAPETPTETDALAPQILIQTDNDGDISEAAWILCLVGQSKRKNIMPTMCYRLSFWTMDIAFH